MSCMDFGGVSMVVGRKDHKCALCWGPIPKGERHVHCKGMWEGDFQDWRAHQECYDVTDTEDGFCAGDLPWPERIQKLYAVAA